ncbi:MAG: hypothetical protein FJ272_21395, partial [Planctomycetes bacterium]|nr:hypothetical protein [Planctomycetota bacterium]
MSTRWLTDHWRPVALAAIYLAVNFPFVPFGLNVHDEGSMAYVAWRLAEGEALYRDISVPVTPGTYYVLSWLFRLFGPYLILGRLWVLLMGLCTCLLIYWVGTTLAPSRLEDGDSRPVGGFGPCSVQSKIQNPKSKIACRPSPGFLAALCYCFWATAHFVSPRPAYEANALTLLALGLAIQHVLGGSRRYLLAGALAAGLSFLFKQNIGLAVPAAFVAVVVVGNLWRSAAGLWRVATTGMGQGETGKLVLIAATIGYLLFLMGRYEAAGVIFVLWGVRQMAARRVLVSAPPTIPSALLFLALSAIPFAALVIALAAAGALQDMLWNVFTFATRFVNVGSSRQADIGAFMAGRLVNFIYAAVALYASARCLTLWRQGRTFEGGCFGLMGLLTVLAKTYHIQSEAMSLVTLWRFYDRTLLIAFAYGATLLLALYLVWKGRGLWRRGEHLGGGYLFALAAILLANKLSAVSEGQLAQFMVEARPQNPWGIL